MVSYVEYPACAYLLQKGSIRMKSKKPSRARGALLATGAISLLTGTASVSFAQDNTDDDLLEEIVVTGSHIKRDTFNYSSPVTVIDEVEISGTGTTNLGDLL